MPKPDGNDKATLSRKEAKTKKGKRPPTSQPQTERKVVYDRVEVREAWGDDPITVDQMKDLMGWEEETETMKFGSDYLLIDTLGRKIRCHNNVTNRPFYMANAMALCQEILNKKWSGPNGNSDTINGEPIIIGRTGSVLNGQHQMVGAIFAEQRRNSDKEKHHWERIWSGPIVLDKLVVFGISESDLCVNTMDTCKPRTLSDVIYRSEHFSKKKSNERRTAARMLDYAIRFLWSRTGAGLDAFIKRRTHAEALDFVARHKRVERAVNHIMTENVPQKGPDGRLMPPPIGRYVSPGYASALLYLMGCSTSDRDDYYAGDPSSEKSLSWDNWEKACEFWTLLGAISPDFKAVRYAIGAMDSDDGKTRGPMSARVAVIVKAWLQFVQGRQIEEEDLVLSYRDDSEGLDEHPTVGGIDLTNPRDRSAGDGEVSVEEIEKAKEAIRNGKHKAKIKAESQTDAEYFNELKQQHSDRVLLFRAASGIIAWGKDARMAAKVLGLTPAKDKQVGLDRVSFPAAKLAHNVGKLFTAGHKVGMVTRDGDKTTVEPYADKTEKITA